MDDEGNFDLESMKRISRSVHVTERANGDLSQFQQANQGNKVRGSNAVIIVGNRNRFNMYPAKFVYLVDHTGNTTSERWGFLTTNAVDCYCIIGHVIVEVNDVFDVSLASIVTIDSEEKAVYLFTDKGYGYYYANSGPLNTVVFQNDTNPQCTALGTITVDRKYIAITAPGVILTEYDYNPNATGGWYVVNGEAVYSVGPPDGGYNSGPYETQEQAELYAI